MHAEVGMGIKVDVSRHAGMMDRLSRKYPDLPRGAIREALARGLGYPTDAALAAAMTPSAGVTYAPSAFHDALGTTRALTGRDPFDEAYASLVARPRLDRGIPRLAMVTWDGSWQSIVAVFPELGCAALDPGCGEMRYTTKEALIVTLVGIVARQGGMAMSPRCGTDKAWYARFWKSIGEESWQWVLPDGTVAEEIYVGMGHWMTDLGPYRGPHPWPGAPDNGSVAS
jgi:hypothetical protein